MIAESSAHRPGSRTPTELAHDAREGTYRPAPGDRIIVTTFSDVVYDGVVISAEEALYFSTSAGRFEMPWPAIAKLLVWQDVNDPDPPDPPSTRWPRLGVYKLAESAGYMVPSAKTAPGAYWHVREAPGHLWVCDCPAGQRSLERGSSTACRHFVLSAKAEQMSAGPRPVAPVNVSALTD